LCLTEFFIVRDSFERLVSQWEGDDSLLEANHLCRRAEVLDQLDAYFSDADFDLIDSELHQRARAICTRLEAANSELYQAIRHEIQRGICPAAFVQLRLRSKSDRSARGNGYDYLDELISGVLQFDEPAEEPVHIGPEMVFYQPTPARHIFAMITAGAISADDVLVDLGSGLGHVPLLVSICTGARSIGVEVEPSYVACARQCAERLNLNRVTFFEGDARDADFSSGTVFFLYTPFRGSILQAVMNSLKEQAAARPIKICTFGPCTSTIAEEPWLEAMTTPETDRITVFLSRA
jgi:Histone methylation protein DOT1